MPLPEFLRKHARTIFNFVVLIILFLFLLNYFDLRYLLLNTTPTGGDTPAHNYLVRHLKDTFFSRGAVISWAKGWWCGFPMYQYYFFLPYWLMALLSFIIPINIAFKIVSILGILLLPTGVYYSLKWMKFPEPVPILGAIGMVPFLFVETHTMWGVNIYSTLAGEISNSVSFVLFALFLGSIYNDMEELRFRLRTVVLFVLLFYSHFFTSVIAAGASFILLFLFDRKEIKTRLWIYFKTGFLTFLLISWWIVPLLAKSLYSMEFGGDWEVVLWKSFPIYTLGMIPFILYALFEGFYRKRANILYTLWLAFICVIAFYTGGKINASFTNIRFWPFIYYTVILLTAAGVGYLLEKLKGKELLVAAIIIAILMIIANSKNNVRAWAKWNYEGLESKADYSTLRDLVMPLDNTPGRLANDLHEYNDHLGSTRVFETVPALIHKDILEGGIVNSATGSMFSYYIQGETSKNCAGFPTIVNPTTFNIDNATKHLKLANVKHFIAHWDTTRNAMLHHPEWKLLKTAGQYQLFELTTNDGKYVYIPKNKPLTVKTRNWKESDMEWIYTIRVIDTPFILDYNGKDPSTEETSAVLTEEQFLSFLSGLSSDLGEVPIWLTLGPFYFSSGTLDETAADMEFAAIDQLKPEAGKVQFGKTWRPILRKGPIFLDSLYNPKLNFVSYNCVNINSDKERKILFHYSNDDSARIYLNGKQVVRTRITGLNNSLTQEVTLRAGVNQIIYKVEQSVGGVFFQLKLSDLAGQPIKELTYSIGSSPRTAEIESNQAASSSITEEEVSDQRIHFRTTALHQPHIIKMSYFPNWKVIGAKRIYHVTPNFMLVYPDQPEVTLYYGSTFSDLLGRFLTLIGVALCAGVLFRRSWAPRS